MKDFHCATFVSLQEPAENILGARVHHLHQLGGLLAIMLSEHQGRIFTVRLNLKETRHYGSPRPGGAGAGVRLEADLTLGEVREVEPVMYKMPEHAFYRFMDSSRYDPDPDLFWRPAMRALWKSVKKWFAKGAY